LRADPPWSGAGWAIRIFLGGVCDPVTVRPEIPFITFLLLASSSYAIANRAGDISLMLLGDVGRLGSPIDDWLDQDLVIDYFEIPMAQTHLSQSELKRYTAIYFPRTEKRFLELYNMVVVCEEEGLFSSYLSDKQKMMVYNGVKNEGVALFNSVPNEDFEEAAWSTCIWSELMPHDYSGQYKELTAGFSVSVVKRSDFPPIFTPFISLGIEKYIGPLCRQLNPKIGARTWAWVEPYHQPFFLSWEIGEKKARTSNVANDLDEPWWGSAYRGTPSQNPYGGDLFLNMVYWSVGKKPITDIFIVHSVRKMYGDYLMRRKVTLSLVDFIDAFGANTHSIEDEVEEINGGRSEARRLYYEQKYDEAMSYLQRMLEKMVQVDQEAVELKKRAFLWIYLVEWLAVTAVSLVTGVAIWALMVKRRMYREIATTRAV